MITQRRRIAFSVIFAILVGSSLASAQRSDAEPSSTFGPENYATFNPGKLPNCPPPTAQVVPVTKAKPLTDMSGPHCQYVPSTGGTHVAGFADDQPLHFDEAWGAKYGGADVDVVKHATVGATGQEGISETNRSHDRWAVAATLYAQTPTLFARADVYNWVGLQDDTHDLSQIGISYNNLSFLGTAECSGNNDVNYRPMVLGQIEYAGAFQPGICFPAYVFGPGTQTFFQVSISGGWLQNWINWNGTWVQLFSAYMPNLYPGKAQADLIPAEVIPYDIPQTTPTIGTIADQNGQLASSTGWAWWTTSTPTSTVSSVPGMCLQFPTPYSNTSAVNC